MAASARSMDHGAIVARSVICALAGGSRSAAAAHPAEPGDRHFRWARVAGHCAVSHERRAFALDAGEKRFILGVSKDRLKNAPGFDKDHWPSMADPTWATEVHAYYNVTPYWDDELDTARDRRSSPDVLTTPRVY